MVAIKVLLLRLLGLQILAAVAVALEVWLAATAGLAVQVTHELLIGVNYGTTLCIS
jgi:hypothetical protein